MHTEWCCCWSLAMYGWPVELKPCHDCQAPQIHRSLSKEQLLDTIGRMNESLHSDGHLHLRKWVFEKSGMPHPHHPCIHICRWPKMQRYLCSGQVEPSYTRCSPGALCSSIFFTRLHRSSYSPPPSSAADVYRRNVQLNHWYAQNLRVLYALVIT